MHARRLGITAHVILVLAIVESASAKNVILMVSDGTSFNTWNAAAMYQGKWDSLNGKSELPYEGPGWIKLPMTTYPLNTESSPTPGLVNGSYDSAKVYATTDYADLSDGYTDSAAAATAFATGTKTYNNAINWSNESSSPLTTIWEIARGHGLATGAVTTVQWSHATPAAFGAHNISRNNYSAIAHEMLTSGKLDVIMGAGNPDYTDNNLLRSSGQNYTYVGGQADWAGLKDGTLLNANGTPAGWNLIESKSAFDALAQGTSATRVCGTARVATTLQQTRSGSGMGSLNPDTPTLATMSVGALNVLQNRVNAGASGMFVMIEGGAVDWAAHAGQASRLIQEKVDFDNAVGAVVNWVNTYSNWNDTVLIVTTDHGNSLAVGTQPADNQTPLYSRLDASSLAGADAATLGTQIHLIGGTHTNELVPVFAYGYGAEQFLNTIDRTDLLYKRAYGLGESWGNGFVDNTDVFKVMNYAITGTPVPEPAVLAVWGIAAVFAMRRRRLD